MTTNKKAKRAMPALSDGATYCSDGNGGRICTGSQMGRRDLLPDDRNEALKLRMVLLRFVDGCYDQGGAYWGAPANVYRARGDGSELIVEVFVRGNSRTEAKAAVRAKLPNAKFFS